jgi:hypothetical protein
VYKRENLEMAWEKVKANRGSGGVDGQNLEAFAARLDQQLDRLQRELKEDTYQLNRCGKYRSRRRGNQVSFICWACPLSMIGHLSRCFSMVKDWVDKKVRRHLMHARKRRGFGWKRWSSDWLYGTLGLFNEYRVLRMAPQAKVFPG